MTNSPRITVTGADERTPIDELQRLVSLSPCVEIGLLYSETPEGRNRYPRSAWLRDAILALRKRCAVHVCGSMARKLAIAGQDWISVAGRVQVNGHLSECGLSRFCQTYPFVITQHKPGNELLERAWVGGHLSGRHSLLVDASGGRGLSPPSWERVPTHKPVGFAGGLGPHNLASELPLIKAVSRPGWWVDMEGRLRTEDDWFSVELAERAIEQFVDFVSGRLSAWAPGSAGGGRP